MNLTKHKTIIPIPRYKVGQLFGVLKLTSYKGRYIPKGVSHTSKKHHYGYICTIHNEIGILHQEQITNIKVKNVLYCKICKKERAIQKQKKYNDKRAIINNKIEQDIILHKHVISMKW